MKFVSAFAGVGGFDVGLARAGMECAAQIEWDKNKTKVLAEHWPTTPRMGDITEVAGSDIASGVSLFAGGFPCFPAGTLITAEAGLKPIEDLLVGDIVLTHERRWRHVTATMNRYAFAVIRVKAMGAPALRTTDEHPFWVRRSPTAPPEWVKAADLERGQYVGYPLDTPGVVPPIGEPLARLAGRWLGDGWVQNQRRTSKTPVGQRGSRVRSRVWKAIICCDASEEQEVAELVAAAGYHATVSRERTDTRFIICSKQLVCWLMSFGSGAAGKQIPGWAFELPVNEQAALLDGWLSADGCNTAGLDKGSSVSETLAFGLARLARNARRQAVALYAHTPAPTTVIEGRTVNQRARWDVVIAKRNREAFVDNDYVWAPIRSVEREVRTTRVFNISVEEDESYVASGIAVHNCQDVALKRMGGRPGLAGDRSGHFFSFTRLADEYARLVDHHQPRWVVVENVPGLLSSNSGRDMGAVVGTLEDLGYGLAWRVLDSGLGFGLPQQRLRLLLVGHRGGDGRPAAAVLHHTDGSGRDPRTDQPKGRPPRPSAGGSVEEHLSRLIFRKSRRAQSTTDFETWVEDTYTNCLTAFDVGDKRATQLIIEGNRARRLTPRESERLMGFDDDWTITMPEGRRQPALGEAVTVPMCEWLGRRIRLIDQTVPYLPDRAEVSA